jgi:hypothetical protein
MEIVLDVKKNKSKTLPKLFCVEENRSFSCPLHPGKQQNPRGSRQLGFLNITKSMFQSNDIDCTNVGELINRWATGGLDGISGLQCSACNSKKYGNPSPASNYLHKKSTISIINGAPPAHLHFHVNAALLSNKDEQIQFMGGIDWPFKVSFSGEEYTLVSRGFWGNSHYWGKVLRHVNGVTAFWMHDDRLNAGIAQLVDRVPGSISGAQPHTSWMIYSRQWTPNEKVFIDKSIVNIQRDKPTAKADDIPFINMGAILQATYDSALPHLTQGQTREGNPTITIMQSHGENKLQGV